MKKRRLRPSTALCASLSVLASGCLHSPENKATVDNSIRFQEITEEVGLVSVPTWKYGGPTVADLEGDGDYDLVLTNHHEVPAQMFEQVEPGKLVAREFSVGHADMHGIAAGDYDGDGDLDLLAALGGGNGLQPRPPVLLRNDDWTFVDVTDEAGLGGLGARGRAVRWIDIDRDGDLDIIAINARQVIDEAGPRNIVYENLGNGSFRYRRDSGLEQVEAERMVVSDFDGDFVPDLVLFSPLSMWRGNGDFTFEDMTAKLLPEGLEPPENITAVAESDIDNDGDFDLYLARGKTYYELANNSLDFDEATGRFDLRDEGNRGSDGLSFSASGAVTLTDFWHWKRRTEIVLPVHIGASAKPVGEPAEPLAITPEEARGFPTEFPHEGWYLGYLGAGKWRLEWHLSGDLAWGLRASVIGVDSVDPDFSVQDPGLPDILLLRDGAGFRDGSAMLPDTSGDNNWGVTAGDFDNDGLSDLFVYRFGKLRQRLPDALLHNLGSRFASNIDHNASGDEGHGDMGAAFDWDGDGRIDILSGDDNAGRWRLFRNVTATQQMGAVSVRIGTSPGGTDPHGAVLTVEASGRTMHRRIGSNGATHSQSLLNMQHVGIGQAAKADRITVTWRDGTTKAAEHLPAGSKTTLGSVR